MKPLISLMLLALAGAMVGVAPGRAATTYTVTSLADDGSAGTLRSAMNAANAGSTPFYLDRHDFGGTTTNTNGTSGPDGNWLFDGVTVDAAGNIYGTTFYGGQYEIGGSVSQSGMIWEITASGVYKDLHDFGGTITNAGGATGPDGVGPVGGVTIDTFGNLHGTTYSGGALNRGIIWEITASGTYMDLHDFGGTVKNVNGVSVNDGWTPSDNVTFDSAGNMYGTAGPNGGGMIWKLTSSGVYTDLHDFGGTVTNADGISGPDGNNPESNTTFDPAGDMYGTTNSGGPNGDGVVWEITASGTYKDLHDFGGTVVNADGTNGPDGSSPWSGATFDSHGNMFGTAESGGPNANQNSGGSGNAGMVWEITAGGTYKDVHDFGSTASNLNGTSVQDGANPVLGVTFDAGGNMYGTTTAGGGAGLPYYRYGMAWEITSNGIYIDLHDFGNLFGTNSPDGFEPYGGVALDSAGDLYGTTFQGGQFVGGMVWEIPATALHSTPNPGATIQFQTGLTGTITLTSALPTITTGITIDGPGASSIAIDGAGQYRPFNINAQGSTVAISGQTIQNGSDQADGNGGGGIELTSGILGLNNCVVANNDASGYYGYGGGLKIGGIAALSNCIFSGNQAPEWGGGIANEGNLSLTNCTLSGNAAGVSGSAGTDGWGGALLNVDSATVTGCTFTGSNAIGGGGGAVMQWSNFPIDLVNCTITGCGANWGGAAALEGPSTVTNCTLSGNTATTSGGAIQDWSEPGQFGAGSSVLTNCILYGDTGGEVSDEYSQAAFAYCDIDGGYAGTGNIDADPLLGALANNGGTSETMALGLESPCFAAGTSLGAPATDQRGVTRPNPPSIGAYDEPNANITLTSSANPAVVDSAVTFTANVSGEVPPGAVQFLIDGANAGLPVPITAAGVATFSTSALAAGSHQITATFSGELNNLLGSTAGPLAETVNAVSKVVVSPSTATVALGSARMLTASVADKYGDSAPAASVAWSLGRGSVGAISSAGSFSSTVAGTATVDATVGTVVGTAAITVPDVAPTINSITASPNPLTGTTTVLGASITDAGGPSAITSYLWNQTAGPSGATFSSPASSSPTVTFTQPGTYTFSLKVTNKSGLYASATVSVTVANAIKVVVTPTTTAVALGATQLFSAAVSNQFGPVTNPAIVWSRTGVGSIDQTGNFSAGTVPGSSIVTATFGSTKGTAAVTVPDGPPTVTSVTASPNPVTGVSTLMSATVGDAAGTRSLTYAWSQTAGPSCAISSATAINPKVTFTQTGSYTFAVQVTNAGGLSAGGTVTVTVVSKPATITVSPNPVTVAAGTTQQFTANVIDQFGNADPGAVVTWSLTRGSVGSINTSGLFTGSAVGTATVVAAVGTLQATALVTVPDGPPSITKVSATPSPVSGTTTTLQATVSDAAGLAGLTYQWTVTSGPSGSTFSSSATVVSPTVTFTQAGTYVFGLTVTNKSAKTATGSVTVTVTPTYKVTVTPATATVALGASKAFTAAVSSQFGTIPSPNVVWSVSGVGTVSSSGSYSAGAVPGTATVTAIYATGSGAATVTVPDGPPTLSAVTATPATVTGTTTTLGETDSDAAGTRGLTYAWSQTSGLTCAFSNLTIANPTVTFTQSGTYVFALTITNAAGLTATGSVTVTVVSTAKTLTVSPNQASVAAGASQQFTATILDQFGNTLAGVAVTWSVAGSGKISTSGLYIAGSSAGTATVTGSVGRSPSGTTSVTVTAG